MKFSEWLKLWWRRFYYGLSGGRRKPASPPRPGTSPPPRVPTPPRQHSNDKFKNWMERRSFLGITNANLLVTALIVVVIALVIGVPVVVQAVRNNNKPPQQQSQDNSSQENTPAPNPAPAPAPAPAPNPAPAPAPAPALAPAPAPAPAPQTGTACSTDTSQAAGEQCAQAFFNAWKSGDVQAASQLAGSVCENCDNLFPPGNNGTVFTYSAGWNGNGCGPDADNPPDATFPIQGVVCTYARKNPDPSGQILAQDANGNYTINFYARYYDNPGRWEVNRVLS